MKENLYRSMMEQIQLSDDADRRIRTALEQEVRRKRRHPLGRAGLAAAVAALLITTALGAQLLKSAVFVPHLGPQAGQWEEYVSGDTFAQCQAGRNAISVVSTLFTANSVNLIVEITPWTRLARGRWRRICCTVSVRFTSQTVRSASATTPPSGITPIRKLPKV